MDEPGWVEEVRRQARSVDMSGYAVVATSLRGEILYWNSFAERFYGWRAEEVIGRRAVEFLVSNEFQEQADEIMAQLKNGDSWSGEFIVRHKDGSRVPVLVTDTPVSDEQGDLLGIIGVSSDVTWDRRAEDALRDSEERFRRLYNTAFEGILIHDGEKVLEVNEAFSAIYGYEKRELVGKPGLEFIAPESRDLVRRHVFSGSEEPYEVTGVKKDGSHLRLEVSGRSFLYRGSRVRMVSVRDVTARKRVEKALRESEERFKAQYKGSPVPTYSWRRTDEGEFVLADYNEAARETTYGRIADLLGVKVGEMYPDRPEVLERLSRCFEEKTSIKEEMWWTLVSTGETRYFIVSFAFVPPDLVMLHTEDITARKQAEDALREGEERYRAVVEQSVESIYLYDAESRRVLESNGAFQNLIGYSGEELRGMEIYDFIAHDRENIDANIRRSLEEGRRFVGERDYRHKDGSIIIVVTSASVVPYQGRTAICAVSRDITGRKQYEEALRESEARFRAVFDKAVVGMALVDVEGWILESNPALRGMLGYESAELHGKHFSEVTHPEDVGADEERFARLMAGDFDHFRMEKRYICKDGSLVWGNLTSSVVRDADGDPQFMIGMVEDITERKEAENALRENEHQMRLFAMTMNDMLWISDLRTEKVTRNAAFERAFGYSRDEIASEHEWWEERLHPDDRERILSTMKNALAGTATTYSYEYRFRRRDDSYATVADQAYVVRGEEGNAVRVIGATTDITERKQAEEQLEHQAFHDALTGLPNRYLFTNRLEHALARSGRRAGKVAVLFMDLDNFKVVNDSLGHESGDHFLQLVADRLKDCLRPGDTLARFGGDEFTVLLEDVADPSDAARVAGRISEELQEPFSVDSREVFATASIGISLGFAGESEPELVLRDADTAMYQAKEQGGVSYRIFDPSMYARVLRRLEMENDLRRAVEQEQFQVYYQPQVNLKSGEVVGVEALVRWNHPEHGLVSPGEFIAVAEETGLILPIGQWVLERACRQAVAWREELPASPAITMNVNLSARQLQHPSTVEVIERVLRDTGLEPACLGLDVTETVLIEAADANTAVLERIRGLGVRISIDDFGKGYSSLSYLKRLPADTLKIDQLFVRGIGEDIEDLAITQMITDLAHTVGMHVVAEGVETEQQAAQLVDMGCEVGQGFYFAKALPEEAASEFLRVSEVL